MQEKGVSATSDSGERVTLRAGRAELELSLEGGCITAFRWHREGNPIDWMRPAPSTASFAPTEAACFPLVPYSNRIREGRFSFEGESYQLAPNFPPERHAIHGHGWQNRWRAANQAADAVTLVFDYPEDSDGDGSDWPASYRAEQRFELSEQDLMVEIAVSNTGTRVMPAGLGLHPYFPRTPECRLTAAIGRMWESDAEVMPADLVVPPPDRDPSRGIQPAKAGLDNCFTDFGGQAVMEWPEWGAKLTMTSEAVLGFLVVYTPPGERFFCVEPVSAITDAVNLAQQGRSDSGFRSLAPGARFAARTVFTPHLEAG
ncbi:aldose 1-epimerase [Pelagibius sp.]|uniref:aldose 1-epimerase n=1 Tax=Pelagibius sp. TaxID=1931238 RepID=UPI0026158AD8|nr:aldose 1-epimerase [Pelagibius sp.]